MLSITTFDTSKNYGAKKDFLLQRSVMAFFQTSLFPHAPSLFLSTPSHFSSLSPSGTRKIPAVHLSLCMFLLSFSLICLFTDFGFSSFFSLPSTHTTVQVNRKCFFFNANERWDGWGGVYCTNSRSLYLERNESFPLQSPPPPPPPTTTPVRNTTLAK